MITPHLPTVFVVQCPSCKWYNKPNDKVCYFCGSPEGWTMRKLDPVSQEEMFSQPETRDLFDKGGDNAAFERILGEWKMEILL